MTGNKKVLVLILCALLSTGFLCAEKKARYVYTWHPRDSDVSGEGGAKDRTVLRSLLQLVRTAEYTVENGESLDYIIRKTFLVSTQWGNAYALYFSRIKELNPQLKVGDVLRVGQKLVMPVGPQYGATELAKQSISAETQDQSFLRLSAEAYGTSKGLGSIQKHAVASLSHFVSLSKVGSPADLFARIRARGLVAPVDVDNHPEEVLSQIQTLAITVGSDAEGRRVLEELEGAETGGNLLPGMFPVAQNVNVSCGECSGCAETLQVPPGIDLSAARVLVEDTGVDHGYLASDANLLDVQVSPDKGADLSDVHHGTFVYSEIASLGISGRKTGPIPKAQVFVSRVARFQDGDLQFSMEDIIAGWRRFSEKMKSDPRAAKTWVVNVSAEGEPPAATNPRPSLPPDPHLLIIAAAGNGGSGIAPSKEAFDRLSNGNSNLIIIGALGADGQKASYSNFHDLNVQLFTRGDCVCGVSDQINGTSQAAPVVSTAAAVVAAARPKWYPPEVMWRLLTTADPLPNGQAFAGVINLGRALDRRILVKMEGVPQASTVGATSVRFDDDWASRLKTAESVTSSEYRILRLQQSKQIGDQTCFTYLRFLQFDHRELCVPSTDTVTLLDSNAQNTSVPASRVLDIQLPLPSDRSSQLPQITIATP